MRMDGYDLGCGHFRVYPQQFDLNVIKQLTLSSDPLLGHIHFICSVIS
jgi:hypothetical protein